MKESHTTRNIYNHVSRSKRTIKIFLVHLHRRVQINKKTESAMHCDERFEQHHFVNHCPIYAAEAYIILTATEFLTQTNKKCIFNTRIPSLFRTSVHTVPLCKQIQLNYLRLNPTSIANITAPPDELKLFELRKVRGQC